MANIHLAAMLLLSVCLSGYSFYLGTIDTAISDELAAIWFLVYSLLLVLWFTERAKLQLRGFDWPAWLFVFWPLLLPFYLWREKGLEGLVMYAGIFAIYGFYTVTNSYGYWYFSGPGIAQ
jgi:hypothetical protein